MSIAKNLSKNFLDVHFGGNWTVSNLKDHLKDVTWQQSICQVHHLNSIATLTYHSSYYVNVLIKVLEGGLLDGKDEDSFQVPPIQAEEDWEKIKLAVFENAKKAATLIATISDEQLLEIFSDGKYGNYFRNISGVIEHLHYHLGQIVLIRKIILQNENRNA